ncbi:hypothetical protein EH223_15985 [candidate division KSB1 bacterium]|nr:hypothetical protein [candidate division KSB1 bacterium]RQW01195.1 MAG: hypothetical protein EH223_15985 [candidate division KSB1 bacterium]
MNIKFFLIIVFFVQTIYFSGYPLSAKTYYVDQDNPVAGDRNSGTMSQPWKTITKANHALNAGDTVFIRGSTYYSFIEPDHSGRPSSPIIYRNYGEELVTISNAKCGILLNGRSHIVVHGIYFYNLDQFLWLQNGANHNIIEYCIFDQGRNVAWSGSRIYRNSAYNWIHHCQFSNYGYYHSDDIGSILDIGDEESRTDESNYNLLEDNVFFHGGHHILGVFGMYNVIRGNYFHNEPWSMGTAESDRGAILYGNRNVYCSGYPDNSGRNLFEENRVAYSSDPPDNIGASGMALCTSYNIVRFNQFYFNDRAGLSMTVTSSYYSDVVYNKIYHNTFFYNGINTQDPDDHMNSGIAFGLYSGPLIIKSNTIKNNLLFKHRVPFGSYKVDLAEQSFANNWDGDLDGNPKFVNADIVLGDPLDANYPDLHLQADSPCRDAGRYLTTIISVPGSSTSLQVDDAGYFMDGWGIVRGDNIQLFGSEQRAVITHVDYQSNMITLDRLVTWTKNQGVCLAYHGAAPDIGACEVGQEANPLPPVNLRFLKSPPHK